MLHNICGRSKSGKTEHIFKVCSELIQNKKHVFLIVPEQGAVITERQVIERLSNRSNEYIEVINFKRLCNRVFRETGGLTQSYVDSAHKLLVMHKALSESRGFLTEYKGASEVSDFVKKAVDTVSEFRMYGVTPKALEESSASLAEGESARLSSKLLDFSLIYAQYNALLTETFGYHDSSDDLDRLCEVLDSSRFFKGKTVIIDSFYGFTVPELHVIESILKCCDDLYVTYLCDKENEVLFRRGLDAYNKISGICERVGEKSETIYTSYDSAYSGSDVFELEKGFASDLYSKVLYKSEAVSDGSVRLLECEDPYEEARMAAATVRYLVSKKGARYSDIAICARSLKSYSGILDTELRKNGIPFGFSMRYELLTRPVSAYILSAFDFSRHKSKQSVLRILKTGLSPLTDKEADLTECYIRTWNIQGRMFTDYEWLMNPDGYTSADEMSDRARKTLDTVEGARIKLITPLSVFDEEIRSAECANDISRAIIRLLESSHYNVAELTDDEKVYHNMVMDALDCIADVIGSEKVSPARYAALFEMILSEYDTGKIPVSIDEVNVADASLIRTNGNKYMIVMGLCDGVFPMIPGGNGVFSDREKEILSKHGIQLSETSIEQVYDELFLAYKVLSSPTKGLYLSYTLKNASGEKSSPSEIVSMCKAVLPSLSKESAGDATDLRFCLCDESLISEALDSTRPELSFVVSEYLTSKGYNLTRLKSVDKSFLEPNTAEMLFGDTLTLSPSRLDSFNKCACSYFAQYTLALKPEPTANLGPSESGTIIHRILELLISELSELRASGKEITVDYALKRQKELLDAHITELIGAEKAQKQMSKRFKYLYERLSGALGACVSVMAGEFTDSEFIPTDFEMSIGTKDADVQFASIPICDEAGNVEGSLIINGKIDRTDVYKKGDKAYIKILDYKTGHKVFNLKDVANGINLQMLLYLYSLTENASMRYGCDEIVPAGVVYAPIRRPSLSVHLGKDTAEDTASSFKPNGIVIDDMEILSCMDRTFSGRYVPVKLKKDGTFNSHSSVTSLETMGRLLNTCADVASKLAHELKKGKISKNPYKTTSLDSCKQCDFAAFCRYKRGDEGTRYAMTAYSDEVFLKSTEEGD